ncbi:hypothetical protein [Microbacterium maritypicum]|uniref:hypothetical protein n=1 Tax=Microbacterium maritypicum TaxID=33918 RepID=UPI0035570D57
MRHDPPSAEWSGRDRSILSLGIPPSRSIPRCTSRGTVLMKDIEELRAWESLTPGHL